jgi:hypothetical protein
VGVGGQFFKGLFLLSLGVDEEGEILIVFNSFVSRKS